MSIFGSHEGIFEFVWRVLTIYDDGDCHDALFWRSELGARLELFAMCNDVFYWATADAEPITRETLPILEQALADLKAIDKTWALSELYAARVRKLRPQRPWLKLRKDPELVELFMACGPERDPKDEG